MIEKYDTYDALKQPKDKILMTTLVKLNLLIGEGTVMANNFFDCCVPPKKGKTSKIGEKTAQKKWEPQTNHVIMVFAL